MLNPLIKNTNQRKMSTYLNIINHRQIINPLVILRLQMYRQLTYFTDN